jgi:hypothetical protein
MYRTCIFCSSDLGENEALEHFPVGARLAFDAWQGRLWAVCGKCGRWNLSPIEERWEAVEEAEKHFRDSRLRVHSENIGLAKLPDGTRLIRVGEALPGELAAWRYGDMLRHRRYRHWLAIGGAVAAGGALLGGVHLATAAGLGAAGSWGPQLFAQAMMYRKARTPIARLAAPESPTGEELLLRRIHLNGARLTEGSDGGVAVRLPYVHLPHAPIAGVAGRPVVLQGEAARSVIGRAMVDANARGASQRRVDEAIGLLTAAGGPEAYLHGVAGEGRSLGLRPIHSLFYAMSQRGALARTFWWMRFRWMGAGFPPGSLADDGRERQREWRREYRRANRPWKNNAPQLAVEMALHEESERRALEGELAALEAAWREAEEIAHIADSLLDDPPGGPVGSFPTDTPHT